MAIREKESRGGVLLSKAWAWIGRETPFFEKGEPGEQRGQVAVVELALVCSLARRVQSAGKNAGPPLLIEDGLRSVERAFGGRVFAGDVLSCDPGAFLGHLIIWLALQGRKTVRLPSRRAVQALIDRGYIVESERTPSRMLELRYFLDQARVRHGLPPAARIFQCTALASRGSPLQATASDFYSMTHVVPYLTDFGFQRSPLFRGEEGSRIRRKLRLMLGIAIRSRHPDLTAELVMNLACLGTRERPWVEAGRSALAAWQNDDGWFPSAGVADSESDEEGGRREAFLRRYHSVLMALLSGLTEKAASGTSGRGR